MDGIEKCKRCGRPTEILTGRHLFGAECKPLDQAEIDARRLKREQRDAELARIIDGGNCEAPEAWGGLIDDLTRGRG